jgi:hypothetical protein
LVVGWLVDLLELLTTDTQQISGNEIGWLLVGWLICWNY